MLAIDGSRFTLPSWTKEVFPSTDDNYGGVKLTAMMSLLNPMLEKVIITDARQHDRKAIKLSRWLHGLLLLMDRGYCDRKLFAQIEDRKGFFLIRFKKNFRPRITCIRSRLDQRYLGESFRSDLPFDGDVDVDLVFKMPGGGEREFRVVHFVVGYQQVKNRQEPVDDAMIVLDLCDGTEADDAKIRLVTMLSKMRGISRNRKPKLKPKPGLSIQDL